MGQEAKKQSLVWTDSAGREWSCRIGVADARRLKDRGTDLLDSESMKTFFADSLNVIESIAESLRPQWESKGLEYVDFFEVITESEAVYRACTDAFVAGLADFFRRIGRPAMAAVVEKAFAAMGVAEETMIARVNGPKVAELLEVASERMQKEFDQNIDQEIDKIRGAPSGSWRVLSDSTRGN